MNEIAGFVLRSSDKEEVAKFYERIGLVCSKHRHGGPVHVEVGPMSKESVLEIYTISEKFQRDALMVKCKSVTIVLVSLAEIGITADRTIGDGKMVYVSDPDGRPVLLIEEN